MSNFKFKELFLFFLFSSRAYYIIPLFAFKEERGKEDGDKEGGGGQM